MKTTIFFGNGINRLEKTNKSWDDLLNEIKQPKVFQNEDLPNTMIYERLLFEKPIETKGDVLLTEYEIKEKVANEYSKLKSPDIYKRLHDIKAENFITTNYDYLFHESFDKSDFKFENMSTEDIYSIRRKIEVTNGKNHVTNIWHIHGEISKSKTIMLGLDHYAGEIGKIDSFIKGRYEYRLEKENIRIPSINKQLINNKFPDVSWIELFFNSNIHIIGFSMDYSEIDLWWILTKRARLSKIDETKRFIRNRIFFYCNRIKDSKKGLLESLGVTVITIPLAHDDTKSRIDNFYKFFEKINNEIQ